MGYFKKILILFPFLLFTWFIFWSSESQAYVELTNNTYNTSVICDDMPTSSNFSSNNYMIIRGDKVYGGTINGLTNRLFLITAPKNNGNDVYAWVMLANNTSFYYYNWNTGYSNNACIWYATLDTTDGIYKNWTFETTLTSTLKTYSVAGYYPFTTGISSSNYQSIAYVSYTGYADTNNNWICRASNFSKSTYIPFIEPTFANIEDTTEFNQQDLINRCSQYFICCS